MQVTRRSFLKWLAAGCSLVLSACARPFRKPAPPLSSVHLEILEAATHRLIPSDDLPGAKEAHVIGYIEKALELRFYRTHRANLERGAALLDSAALRDFGRPFVALSDVERDRVLAYAQRQDRQFFNTLHMMTLEGFLGDPIHGGNQDQAGWQAIGYVVGEPRPGSCGMDH